MMVEKDVETELVAAFEQAGLETSLRTLLKWANNGIRRVDGPRRDWWWVHRTVIELLESAYKLYERRTFIDENS